MSTRDDDALDALIDRVAQDLTAGDPPASLAEHVHARVAGRHRPRWVVAWQPVTAVATLVLTVVLATVALWPERPERPADPAVVAWDGQAGADGGPARVIGGSAPRDPPSIGQFQVGRVPPSGSAGPVRRTDQIAAVTNADVTPLSGIEPLAVSAIDDPVLIAEMSGLPMPIDIEPLQIAPIDGLTASEAGL
jgi:hypothetical protein